MSAVLEFTSPPLGLEGKQFSLDEVEAANGQLYALRNESTGVRLFMVAGYAMPTYRPEISDEQAAELDITDPDDAAVFAIVTPAKDRSTVNLLAPVVVNTRTNKAAQVILDSDWPIRQPLEAMV